MARTAAWASARACRYAAGLLVRAGPLHVRPRGAAGLPPATSGSDRSTGLWYHELCSAPETLSSLCVAATKLGP